MHVSSMEPRIRYKVCTSCDQVLPFSDFYPTKTGFKAECKKCGYVRVKAWKQENKDRINSSNRDYTGRLRADAIETLGGKCSKCGISDTRVLQIDHIDGGGNQERKSKHRVTMWRSIVGGAEGYQLLCANCHCIKSFENGEFGNV